MAHLKETLLLRQANISDLRVSFPLTLQGPTHSAERPTSLSGLNCKVHENVYERSKS